MSRASDSGRKDFNRDQEGRGIRSKVEDELTDRKDSYESSRGDMIRYSSPYGVEDADDDA